MKTNKRIIISFACAFLISSIFTLISHRNNPLDYDMDLRFRFQLTEEESEQEKKEESADQEKKDKDEEISTEHKKEQIQLIVMQHIRKAGPSEGH